MNGFEMYEKSDLYQYKAVVTSIYDADSIRLDIDLGFGVWLRNQMVRLHGIDAWEIRGEEREKGLLAKQFVEDMIPPGTTVFIRTFKDKKGKYGRWIAEVYPPTGSLTVSDALVSKGHAEYRSY